MKKKEKKDLYFILGTVDQVYDRLFDTRTLMTGRIVKHENNAPVFSLYVYEKKGKKYLTIPIDDLIKMLHLPMEFFLSDQMLDIHNQYKQDIGGIFPIQKLTSDEVKPIKEDKL